MNIIKNIKSLFSKEEPKFSEINNSFNTLSVIKCPEYKKLEEYGYIRTIVDIIKVLNSQNHYHEPDSLVGDLHQVMGQYRERKTVSESAIYEMVILINIHSKVLFRNNSLDINELVRLIDELRYDGISPIDHVYSLRQKAKILYAIKFANDFCRYTNPDDLIRDFKCLSIGKSYYGWHTELLDDKHPHMDCGTKVFIENLTKAWNYITTIDRSNSKPTLNNDLLEDYMFTNNEKKIKEKGLLDTLAEDYEEVPSCYYKLLMPKLPDSGPVYVYNSNNQIERVCYPTSDSLMHMNYYECGFKEILMNNMIDRHVYRVFEDKYERIYIPVEDYSRPIYQDDFVEIKFDSELKKIDYIKERS